MNTQVEHYTGGNDIVAQQDEWNRERIELVKRTYCKGASDDELALFVNTCKRTGLSPEARQIFAIKRYDLQTRSEVMTSQTSIDGFRLVAERSAKYRGRVGPYWCGDDGIWLTTTLPDGTVVPRPWTAKEPPAAALCGVRKEGDPEPTWATANWHEYAQTKKDGSLTSMWVKMPALMLGKCAEALALRTVFPAELSGLYTTDEMAQAESVPVAGLTREEGAKRIMAEGKADRAGIDPGTGEILATPIGAPPPKVATKRPPPVPKKANLADELGIADPTVKLLVADLNGIEDPELRKEAKAEFVARFGRPEDLKAEDYEAATAFVSSLVAF